MCKTFLNPLPHSVGAYHTSVPAKSRKERELSGYRREGGNVRGLLNSKKKNLPPFNADDLSVKRERRKVVYQVPILICLKKCAGNYKV